MAETEAPKVNISVATPVSLSGHLSDGSSFNVNLPSVVGSQKKAVTDFLQGLIDAVKVDKTLT